ncbi:Mg-chelatase subunit ChlD [Cystobacter fuscus DSM 2262]|uniref:Mg-chelatase subunit ChlD n=1 Tax=Cystobacter fuscus (strain ATCC 25194 / DSM 2262 / NBRC 100088 / M29) TaxID=1242864 RepID=S9PHF6_CYSF2|nr:VWA domain-containing protein [Cystobacter fuscus]EPX62501.1 Mg-chelatase subunit ChlD [Cystobacter fuscus DSM 2262]
MKTSDEERLERWRLVLGQPAQESLGVSLGETERSMDKTLEALYDSERKAGLGASSPQVARWLGDIREYFPAPVVRVMQGDAMARLGLTEMLLQPEMLAAVEPDVQLVATLLSLRKVIPQKTKETARRVVRKVVDELERRLRAPTERAVRGALSRASRTRRPRAAEIDWDRTLRANLGNYLPERKSMVVEKLVGHGRKRSSLRDVVLCIDQSGSMAASVVYSSIFGAVLASLRAVSTKMVLFDTAVVDLSEQLSDPVDLLFGTQLGGGTDIDQALGYCQQIITRPAQTILVLVTDLYEGGNAQRMLQRAAALVQSGVTVVCLLALSDQGTPSHDPHHAAHFAALGIPTFACTPDLFPELMAAALQRKDLRAWASRQELQVARPG